MDELFQQLARDIGDLVLRAQGADGKVPIQRLRDLQREAGRLVDAAFVGYARQPFDDNNEPQAAYSRIIAEGQKAMIDLALERTAAILDKHMPADVRIAMEAKEVGNG